MGFISIIVENFKRKKLKKCEKNIFIIYSPKNEIIDEADTCTIDTEISIKLPENTESYLATKCEGQEIIKIIGRTNGQKKALDNFIKRILFKQISNFQTRLYWISCN